MEPSPTPLADPTAEPDFTGHYVRTYRWLDTHGEVRSLDIFAEEVRNARVWVYTPVRDGCRVLVATTTAEGRFLRRAAAAGEYGINTAAAWNDLIEICRHAHLARNFW